MDLFSFLYLTTVFISFFAGVYVYTKNPGKAVNRVFLVYSMTVSLITFAGYELGVISDPERQRFWSYFPEMWPMILASQVHLIIIYLVPPEKIKPIWIILVWLIMPFVIIASIVDTYELNFKWLSSPELNGALSTLEAAYGITTSAVVLFLGIRYLRKVDERYSRTRVTLLITGVMIPTFYGMFLFGLFAEMPWSSVVPHSLMLFAGWALILIAIWQYRLFDITPVFAADSILSIIKEAILLVDHNNKIRVANKAFYSITGLTESEIHVKDIKVFFRHCEFSFFNIPEHYPHEELVNKQFYFKPVSGGRTPMIFTNSFLKNRNGRIIGYVFVLTDIKELTDAQDQLRSKHIEMLRLAHQAGMSEMANDVMHNIGNVLTSINISTERIDETLQQSRLKGLSDANALLSEHAETLDDFFRNDDRAKILIEYYKKLEESLSKEQSILLEESKLLIRKFNLIRSAIEMQQDNSMGEFLEDYIDVNELLDEVIMILEEMVSKNNILIDKHTNNKEFITVIPKSRLFNVMLNLVKNAAESVLANDLDDRHIEIDLYYDDRNIVISVADNGSGISAEDMPKLFDYGFTTKKDGNGFGLHYCWNTIKELNGSILPRSAGKGLGAEFKVTIPGTSILPDITQ